MARLAPVAAAVPVAALVASTCRQAWHDSGSIVAAQSHGWLPFAIFAALVLAAVLGAGVVARPTTPVSVALGLLAGLAVWATISLEWSPLPSLARDEGLLTAFYAVSLAVPLLVLRTPEQRLAALAAVVAVLAGFGLLVAARLGFAASPTRFYSGGRLYFPVTYANAQGSLFGLGLWPALLLAARRGRPVAGRALALGAAVLFLATATLAQSKGTVIGLALATVVVLALSPVRLRLLVPAAVVTGLDAVGFRWLVAPFPDERKAEIHGAGRAVLLLTLAAIVLGALYAIADDRLDLGARTVALLGRAAAGAAVLVVVAGAAAFVVAQPHPGSFFSAKWHTFKHQAGRETGSSHFVELGSNRYDFWRVAASEFRDHPVLGCGARCFGPAYLIRGRSGETPVRAHSLPLEVLSEQGLVGFGLLGGALALLLFALARLTRARDAVATGVLGAALAWLAQAFVDWTWSFPSITAPAFVLLGIGASGAATQVLSTRAARLGALVPVAAILFAFGPPWLSARLTDRALHGAVGGRRGDLRWARRLDPVSTAPLLAQAQLAATSTEQLRALREVVRKEPRALQSRYFLGVVLLNSGHRAAAYAELERAAALDPRNAAVRRALALARPKP